MTALADHDALDAQLQRRIANTHRHLAHGFVVAIEEAEIARFGRFGRQRPTRARGVEYFGITNQRLDMRLGKEIRRGGHQQYFRALHVQRHFDRYTGIGFDIFFQAFKRVFQCRAGQAQIVANLLHLAENFIAVLLTHADMVQNFAARHRDFGGIDAVGAEHRATAAFGTLMIVVVPVVEHFLGEILGADQLGE